MTAKPLHANARSSRKLRSRSQCTAEALETRWLLASSTYPVGLVYAPTTVAQLTTVTQKNTGGGTINVVSTKTSTSSKPAQPITPIDGINNPPLFQLNARWSSTVTNGGGLQQGQPTTLRWSVVPDGTPLPSGAGEPATASNLRARMNGIYGSMSVWQPLFAQVFGEWAAVTGLSYVYEPNDDGVALSSSNNGVLNVRGDVRIGGHAIDGNSGILAFDFFPNYGDMVIDTSDNFYDSTFNNSQGLRNVMAHEHGHGIGMFHVDPINQTKLMEAFISFAFDGPQYDDILGANRHYGDRFEKVGANGNDNAAGATPMGTLGDGTTVINQMSIDGFGDSDFFSFTVTQSRGVTVTATPYGGTYLQGPQNGTVTNFNATAQNDLSIQIIGTNGSTVLATANTSGIGFAETLNNFTLPTAGTYFIRVFGDRDVAQMYNLTTTIAQPQVTALIQTVSPDPRTTPISSLTIQFNEAVTGFDKGDLTLVRDGFSESLASATLTTSDNITFTLGNLSAITDKVGSFTLTLVAAGSGITAISSGLPIVSDAVRTWTMTGLNGTSADDSIRIAKNGSFIDVFINNGSATPNYSFNPATLPSLTAFGLAGNDVFTVDFGNGSPVPSIGMTYDGGTDTAGDTLAIVGQSNSDTFDLSNTTVSRSSPASAAITQANNEALDVATGVFTASTDLTPLRLSAHGSNTTVQLNFNQHLGGLTITDSGLVNVPTFGFRVLVTKFVTINTGGMLDLFDNDMIVNNATSNQTAAVQALINAGRNGGLWNGSGITSSAARNANPKITTLGAMSGVEYKSIYGPAASFSGQPISNVATLVKYTYYGDADFNGKVNFDDYARIDAGFNGGLTGWLNGDFNANGTINFDDYALIDQAFNQQSGVL